MSDTWTMREMLESGGSLPSPTYTDQDTAPLVPTGNGNGNGNVASDAEVAAAAAQIEAQMRAALGPELTPGGDRGTQPPQPSIGPEWRQRLIDDQHAARVNRERHAWHAIQHHDRITPPPVGAFGVPIQVVNPRQNSILTDLELPNAVVAGASPNPPRPIAGFYHEGAERAGSRHFHTPVYVAAPFNQRDVAQEAVNALVAEGMHSTAMWIQAHTTPLDECSPAICIKEAGIDLDGIDRAAWCIFIHPNLSTSGGMHVEFGYALAHRKNIILVGERSNIFHHLPLVKRRCGTIADAIATIKGDRW